MRNQKVIETTVKWRLKPNGQWMTAVISTPARDAADATKIRKAVADQIGVHPNNVELRSDKPETI